MQVAGRGEGLRCGPPKAPPFLQDLQPTNLEKGWQGSIRETTENRLSSAYFSHLLRSRQRVPDEEQSFMRLQGRKRVQERIPDPSHHVSIRRPLCLGMAQQRRLLESSPMQTSFPAGQRAHGAKVTPNG